METATPQHIERMNCAEKNIRAAIGLVAAEIAAASAAGVKGGWMLGLNQALKRLNGALDDLNAYADPRAFGEDARDSTGPYWVKPAAGLG